MKANAEKVSQAILNLQNVNQELEEGLSKIAMCAVIEACEVLLVCLQAESNCETYDLTNAIELYSEGVSFEALILKHCEVSDEGIKKLISNKINHTLDNVFK